MKPEEEDEDDDRLASVEWRSRIQLMGMRGVGKKNNMEGRINDILEFNEKYKPLLVFVDGSRHPGTETCCIGYVVRGTKREFIIAFVSPTEFMLSDDEELVFFQKFLKNSDARCQSSALHLHSDCHVSCGKLCSLDYYRSKLGMRLIRTSEKLEAEERSVESLGEGTNKTKEKKELSKSIELLSNKLKRIEGHLNVLDQIWKLLVARGLNLRLSQIAKFLGISIQKQMCSRNSMEARKGLLMRRT